MNDETTIDAYLRRLDRELRLKRAPRQRLLAEAEDHLRSSVDELVADGRAAVDAETETLARFGGAAEVARSFAHAAASATARSAVAWSGATFLAYGITATLFVLAAPSWLRDFPHGAPSMLALQVAGVALAVTAIHAFHCRRALLLDDQRLRLVANGAFIASFAIGAGVGLELLVALTRPAPAPWADASLFIASFGLAAALCIAAAFVATAGYARASGLGAPPGRPGTSNGPQQPSLADDLAAVAPILGRPAREALRRPGLSCVIAAAAAFAAATALQLLGTDFADHASIVAGALTVGVLEAAAIVIGFLTLGRPLGLR